MMAREKLIQWLVPFLVATAVSAFASYTDNDKALAMRVTALETAQNIDSDHIETRLNRLEQKVDRILELLITR
jgi:hypothetical protein